MLYVMVTRSEGKVVNAAPATELQVREGRGTVGRKHGIGIESRNDWHTFEAAKEVAAALGPDYIATDAGEWVSPRYDVIELPKVGAPVSYAFNGDSYPCGEIASISKSLKLIVTTEGQKFYRVRETGCWKYNRTWSLQSGHVYKQNPEF